MVPHGASATLGSNGVPVRLARYDAFGGAGMTGSGAPLNVTLTVNGEEVTVAIDDEFELLCDVLRDGLQLFGTKTGCREGVCGSCNVLMGGELVRSCLVLAGQAQGSTIVTIEGLTRDGDAAPVQDALVRHGAIQCGFCTPGLVVSLTRLYAEHSAPTREQVLDAISGNLCRCTGYGKIVDAVREITMVPR
jgi:carbon-monoxide dehydrogenase small subunit